MENDILVSVIVPVYNVEEYLDKCIESIVNQTYKNIEILLIDDGSTDNSPQKCDDWSKKDERIRVFHKKNGGVSSARNLALKKCNGEFFVCVDPDDYVKENFVEVLLNAVVKNNCGIGIINYIEKYPDGSEKKIEFRTENKLLSREEFLDHLYDENSYKGRACTKIYDKNIVDKYNISFCEDIDYCEDLFFVTKLADKVERFYYEFDEYVYYYYRRDDSATMSDFNSKTATFIQACDEMINIFDKNGVDSSRIKRQYIDFYFLVLYCLKDNINYSKKQYKKICKKYFFDILRSKKIIRFEKMQTMGIICFPIIMRTLREIKKGLRSK